MNGTKPRLIFKTKAEVQSNMDRQKWAELLILQLPETHDGRNSWLLNYGTSQEAVAIRARHPSKPRWDEKHNAAETVSV